MVVNRDQEDLFALQGLAYLGQFLGLRVNDLIVAAGKRRGFRQMRESHGYVIQHLVESDGPISRTGTEIARRMGVSQQAASKTIRELVRIGAVRTAPSKDRRAKEVSLTKRGWEAVLYTRRYRAQLEAKLLRRVGAKRYSDAQETLRDCLELLGGVGRIRSRTVREPE
jgi:DNA-binding MarR family transcriptional regulator